jgi:uncharacterized protein YbgA (DUF1722 family)/uncharacterized protein YbbK (DUF523 family)
VKPPVPGFEAEADDQIRIGISSCLLGENVRFDGGNKHDRFITGTLSQFVRFVPVCPEVEIGLGIPRESLRLVRYGPRGGDGSSVRFLGLQSGTDHTADMRAYAARKVRELAALDLCGYILKKDSPSCGMERVRVYDADGRAVRNGRGMFAAALIQALPFLPVEEEGRLGDPRLRDNFFVRVFAYRRLRSLFGSRWSHGDLVRLHAAEKLLLLAHDPTTYRALGSLVASAKGRRRADLAVQYSTLFMRGLSKMATTHKHGNVLQHIQGHFRKTAGAADRRELEQLVEDFRNGLVPLLAPITLVRHLARVHDVTYLRGQTYLEPHPRELMLRNHVWGRDPAPMQFPRGPELPACRRQGEPRMT